MREGRKYLDLTDGRQLEIHVSYSLGGANYWSGKTEKRGYWLHCGPVKIEGCSTSFTLGSGMKAFLLEVPRKSPKALAQAQAVAVAKERHIVESVLAKEGLTLKNPADLPAAPIEAVSSVSGIASLEVPKAPGMMLLTQEILKRLPGLGATENDGDPIAQVKFFDPCGSWTWYATEFDPVEGLFFGLVMGLEREYGYFSLAELESIRGPMGLGIERDRGFTPRPMSQVRGMVSA